VITKEQWSKLKRGDVVIFRSGPRVVQHGPADAYSDGSTGGFRACHFAIRRRSWTDQIYTVIGWSDCYKHAYVLFSVKRSDRNDVLRYEKELLKEMGFDWRKKFKEIIEREMGRAKRGCRVSLCFAQRAEAHAQIE
jgi:hypothetical protein